MALAFETAIVDIKGMVKKQAIEYRWDQDVDRVPARSRNLLLYLCPNVGREQNNRRAVEESDDQDEPEDGEEERSLLEGSYGDPPRLVLS
jgi:hypothetical protein